MSGLFERFRRDQRGAIVGMVAVLTSGVAVGALVVDGSRIYVERARLQGAADAAALAASAHLPDVDAARAAALDYAERNSDADVVVNENDIVIGTWDDDSGQLTNNGGKADAVSVRVRRSDDRGNPLTMTLARAIGFTSVDIEARAIAGLSGITSPMCMLVLDPHGSRAVHMNGPGDVRAEGCSVRVNSDRADAVRINGPGSIHADKICITGNYQGGSYDPSPETGCPPTPDPLAEREPPEVGSCDHHGTTSIETGTHTIDPGVYCGGLTVTGNARVTLNPGIYVIKDGPLRFRGGGAVVDARGVGFYLTGADSALDMAGTPELVFSPPADGPMEGISIFHDRDADPSIEHSLAGTPDMTFEGTIYMPAHSLRLSGTPTMTSPSFISLIVDRYRSNGVGRLDLAYAEDAEEKVPEELKAKRQLLY